MPALPLSTSAAARALGEGAIAGVAVLSDAAVVADDEGRRAVLAHRIGFLVGYLDAANHHLTGDALTTGDDDEVAGQSAFAGDLRDLATL